MGKKKHSVNRAVRSRVRAGKVGSIVLTRPKDRGQAAEKPAHRQDDHPLAIAFARGKIDEVQFAAGKMLRDLCETLARSGRDSTQLDSVRGGGSPQPWTDTQARAARDIGEICERLGGPIAANYVICRAFCGDGWSMVDAIRRANIPCHPNGILPRVQEALDALAGRGRVETPQKAKPHPAASVAQKKAYQEICPGCGERLVAVQPVRSRFCELVVCLACYREEAAQATAGNSPVAQYRANMREHAEAKSANPVAAKRSGAKKVAQTA